MNIHSFNIHPVHSPPSSPHPADLQTLSRHSHHFRSHHLSLLGPRSFTPDLKLISHKSSILHLPASFRTAFTDHESVSH